MTTKPDDSFDWSLTTWKGSRLQQHRAFQSLPFARKLEIVEQMADTVAFFGGKRPVASESAVREDPPPAS